MGCVGFRVESPEDVQPTIEKANGIDDRPVVIDFRTDAQEKVFPMVAAGQSNDDIIVHLGSSSIRFMHRMSDPATGTEYARLGQFGVQLDLDTRRPAALPERLRAAAARLLVQVAM